MDYITYGSEENGNQSRGVIVYEDKSDMSKAAGRMEYMSKHRSPLLPVQEKLAKVTEQHSEGVMLSAPDSTMILTNMLKFSGAKKCIDVGVFTGYSALSWALSIPEDGKVVALDVSEEDASIGKPFWKEAGVEHKIDLRIAPANQSLQEMLDSGEGGSYDFMYIDADKEGYDTYYELGLKLLRAGGIIAIDNTWFFGTLVDTSIKDEGVQVLRALNEKIREDARVTAVMVNAGDGIFLCLKN